jgi:acetylglutamate kinase
VKLLVKLGGTLLDDGRDARAAGAADRGRLARRSLVVVHGGGRQMTRYLAERGIESQFVNGLRVTTPAVLDAVVKVVAGSVNRQLVATLNRAGRARRGISGIDAGLVEAEQMDPALGSVGRVTRADPALLDALLARRLPAGGGVCGGRTGKAASTTSTPIKWRWPARWRSARTN